MTWLSDRVLDHLREVVDEPDLSGTPYRLVRFIGRGGMGLVYAVQDPSLGREVALKVACDARDAERFRWEARVLARLEHPGIVPIHDVGTLPDGRSYYVMKLVQGERLDRWLASCPRLPAVLRLFQHVCETVAFAHAHDVIHRDLKPENIMVGEFGEALVMDWGVARDADKEEAPGTIVGTRAFMSPEQASGTFADLRSDVYSLGAVLSKMIGPDAPRPLQSICDRASRHDPEGRYPDALALSQDIGHFLDGDRVTAHRETAVERVQRFAARHHVLLTLLLVYVLVRLLIAVVAR